ncbi:hypothetical protein BC831DRAFT_459668 [Entophlyctis helioformis]|nr:hypothetical protein BC831DRAFT_471386 [Entophlyctis helioformis]KAI8925762.1 hypothetical protein BC831DRAFT_459668 [Entophlyctis helioformis]
MDPNVLILSGIFPDADDSLIESVLDAHDGDLYQLNALSAQYPSMDASVLQSVLDAHDGNMDDTHAYLASKGHVMHFRKCRSCASVAPPPYAAAVSPLHATEAATFASTASIASRPPAYSAAASRSSMHSRPSIHSFAASSASDLSLQPSSADCVSSSAAALALNTPQDADSSDPWALRPSQASPSQTGHAHDPPPISGWDNGGW